MNTKNNKTREMYNKIVDGVVAILDSNSYKNFLKFGSKFHGYSFSNQILIFTQMEDATHVEGFKTWQKMGRKLKKGEKGIQIFYPIKKKYSNSIEGQDSLLIDTEKENNKKQDTYEYIYFRPTYVFDVSQTIGDPIPTENRTLDSNNMIDFFEFLKLYCQYKIIEKDDIGSAKGYFSPSKNQIVLKKSLSIDDKVSVLLHELTHAIYDDFNYSENKEQSEIFVESVAYIVSNYFGLDTSECSFNYISFWSKGDIKEILSLGNKIQKTANDFISNLERDFSNSNMRIS